jgi:hypothetical protein
MEAGGSRPAAGALAAQAQVVAWERLAGWAKYMFI